MAFEAPHYSDREESKRLGTQKRCTFHIDIHGQARGTSPFKLRLTPFGRLHIHPRASPWVSALRVLLKKLQAQCDAWNKEHPVGIAVILTDDFQEKRLTNTKSEAEVLGGHTAVVWTELKGCYLLERIKPA